jgi:hypothetical protein
MFNTRGTFLTAVVFAISVLCFFPSDTFAQVEKGTKEILVFSSGFYVTVKEPETTFSDDDGTISIGSFSNSRGFSIGGKFGYFLSQRNEIGAGTNLSVSRSKFCSRIFEDGQLINEECDSDTRYNQGVSGFYRYNFANKGSKRFPFVGAELFVGDLTTNYTGNFKLRPQVGYKYFFNKNVALDLSVGYTMDLNEKKRENDFFLNTGRSSTIDGQVGLSFVF